MPTGGKLNVVLGEKGPAERVVRLLGWLLNRGRGLISAAFFENGNGPQ